MSLFPEQKIAMAMQEMSLPHKGTQYLQSFERLLKNAGSSPTCTRCHWSAERKTFGRTIPDAGVVTAASLFAVHHKDHDHRNYAPANLELLCTACHMCAHMAVANADLGMEGTIILMPDVTQEELVQMWRMSAVIGATQGHDSYFQARDLYDELLTSGSTRIELAAYATRRAKDETTGKASVATEPEKTETTPANRMTPGALAYWVASCSREEYDLAVDYLEGLRFLPSIDEACQTSIDYIRHVQPSRYGLQH